MILRIHIPSFILGYCVCAYLVKNEVITREPKPVSEEVTT